MAHTERKTIGFSPREVAAIEVVAEDPGMALVLNTELLGGLRGTPVGAIVAEESITSFAGAVRRLALLGLTQVHRARLEAQYQQLASMTVFDEKQVAAMGRSTMRALEASLPALESPPSHA